MFILPIFPFELNIVKILATTAQQMPLLALALADYIPWVAAFFCAVFLIKRFGPGLKAREAIVVAVVSGVVARFVFTQAIRFFIDRQRPFEVFNIMPLPHEPGHSFPSGHAAFFFGFAFALWPYHKKTSVAMLVVSVAMGFARVAIAVHWPSDIIAGALVGFASAWLVQWGSRRFLKSDPSTLLGMFFPRKNKSAP